MTSNPPLAMSQNSARLSLVFALLGLGASAAAAYVHYRVLADPTYLSFCDVSATFSCTQVYSSRFGTLFGVSVAVFGAIWFAFATLLSIAGLAGRPAVKESVPAYLFAGSTLGLAVVLYLGYASFFLLKLVCVLCLITYAAVIGLFVVSGAATAIPMMTLPRRVAGDLKVLFSTPVAIALALIFVAGAGSALAFFPREGAVDRRGRQRGDDSGAQASAAQNSELERFMASATRLPLVVPADGAKVLIVKFNDYQCPACGQSYLGLQADSREIRQVEPGRGQAGLEGLPAQLRVQRQHDDGAACGAPATRPWRCV